MRTLKASLLASAFATGAWFFGVRQKIWPAHPQWAVFCLTIGATAALSFLLPDRRSKPEQG